MSHRNALLAVYLAAALVCISAQDTGIYAPYVSRLKASVVDSRVLLSWKDSTDLAGDNLIFRHSDEITAENIGSAELIGRVRAGRQAFTDDLTEARQYFYAVAIENAEGVLIPVFVPYRNKTMAPAGITRSAPAASAPAASAPAASAPAASAPAARAAGVTGIAAEISEDGQSVFVSFSTWLPGRDLMLFWSASPIRKKEDLLGASGPLALEANSRRSQIYPIPGVDTWFAVVDAELFKVGKETLVPGENTTRDPIRLRLAAAPQREATRRSVPLPKLALSSPIGAQVWTGAGGSKPKTLDADTLRSIEILLAGTPKTPTVEMKPEILSFEATTALGGDEYVLAQIVRSRLPKREFGEAETLLERFLGIRRVPAMDARARFYLGQIYYFQDKPREAFLEFLIASDFYPGETFAWKEACYRALESLR